MTVEQSIASAAAKAMLELFGESLQAESLQVQPTRKEFDGEFTLVVFPLTRISKKSPEQTAEAVGAYLSEKTDFIAGYNVVKGFLNLELTGKFWSAHLSEALSETNYGNQPSGSKPLVVVEYSSPNTNKPLHLGHLRNNFLGYSVSEILKSAGHSVKKVQIINDRGIHICKSMLAWQKFGNGETPEGAGVKGDHLVGKYYVAFDKALKQQVATRKAEGMSDEKAENEAPIMLEARQLLLKWEAKDPDTYALWQKMNGWVYDGFEKTYQRMGVDFDKLYFESDTWVLGRKVALEGVSKGTFEQREDGSIWADLTDEGLDQKLLLRRDGTAVYITQDIGTAILRSKDFPTLGKMVYTVGNEQEYHFKVLFTILRKLGHEWAAHCHHLSYGMVELPEGKMKSREGTVVDADDLMQEVVNDAQQLTEQLGKLEGMEEDEKTRLFESIGMAALKYFLLKVDPKKNMLYNPSESLELQGHTGPFIQYAYARIQSVLRKHNEKVPLEPQAINPDKSERILQQKIYLYPSVVEEAARTYNPAIVANYTYDLVKEFNSWYHSHSILQAESTELQAYRLQMASATGQIIRSAMAMLGISVPERM